MKRSALPALLFLCFSLTIQAQNSHLKLIHDFEGQNFDWSVRGMVGMNDSLYVISFTPDRKGMFFRIDGNGDGYKVIWKFDDAHYEPNAIAADDKSIYITTRLGSSGNGLFRYSLEDYSFKLIKSFPWQSDVGEVNIKYVTDSVLWYTSLWSSTDDGSVFTTKLDGTDIKKIYRCTDPVLTSMPSNFHFHENKIYITFYGGGNLYYPYWGGSTYCGSIVRGNLDGTGFETVIAASDETGTNPQSLFFRGNKMIGLFAYAGSLGSYGRLFRSNLDGSDYEALGSVGNRSLTNLLKTRNLIYGVSSSTIYGLNPSTGELRVFDDLTYAYEGWDVVSDAVLLNNNVYVTAQQGGPDDGGTILKWINKHPNVHVPDPGKNNNTGNIANGKTLNATEINLSEIFADPEGDLLTYSFEYDAELVTVSNSTGTLTLTPLTSDTIEVKVTVTDGWGGYNGIIIKMNPFEIVENPDALIENSESDGGDNSGSDDGDNSGDGNSDGDEVVTDVEDLLGKQFKYFVYPNPANTFLKLAVSNVESIRIIGTDGRVHQVIANPESEIDISGLKNGIYFVERKYKGVSHWQKIVKQ